MDDLDYNKEDNKKIYLFSITKMNKYFLFPFLVPLVCFFTKFFSDPIKSGLPERNNKKFNQEAEHTFVFIYLFINGASHILGGLLYFISLLKSVTEKPKSEEKLSEKKEKNNNNNIFENIASSELEKNKFKTIKKISFLVGMAFILTVYNAIKGYATGHPQLEKRLYFLFFFTLFNMFILKKEIFIHHKLSLGIAALGMGILFTYFFCYLPNKYNYIYDILLFFGSFFYSLYLFLIKYLTVNYGMSPFLVILLIGLFSTAFSIFGFIIFSLIDKGNLSYILNLFHCSETSYVCFGDLHLYMIMYLIINAILQVLIILVIYYFCPEVFAISDIISPMLSFYKTCYEKGNNEFINIFINTLGYLIILIGAFIYNEIIVCNFCGLNENTWKAIGERGIDEVENKFRDSNCVDDYIIKEEQNNKEGNESEIENLVNTQEMNIQ